RHQRLTLADMIAAGEVLNARQQRCTECPAGLEGAPPPARRQGRPHAALEQLRVQHQEVVRHALTSEGSVETPPPGPLTETERGPGGGAFEMAPGNAKGPRPSRPPPSPA